MLGLARSTYFARYKEHPALRAAIDEGRQQGHTIVASRRRHPVPVQMFARRV